MNELPPSPWRTAAPSAVKARAVKAPLTRDQIVEAGLRIVVTDGIDGVSMRRLAAEFDTGPSSLYAHVANKDELLQLMFDRICADQPVPKPDPERWAEQLKDMARNGYAAMAAHGDIAKAAIATVPIGPNALRISEGMLAILLAGGVPVQIAAWALDRIFLYITADALEGWLHVAKMRASGQSPEQFGEIFERLGDYYEALPADRFPNIRAHARALVSGGGDQRFEFGLSMLVDGLARYITP
jgi:AcrR family transcriptional regulator